MIKAYLIEEADVMSCEVEEWSVEGIKQLLINTFSQEWADEIEEDGDKKMIDLVRQEKDDVFSYILSSVDGGTGFVIRSYSQ